MKHAGKERKIQFNNTRLAGSGCGFTLVEVMVALVVMSMLMLAVNASMRTFAKTQTSMESAVERVENIRLVSRFVRNSLESSLPESGSRGLSTGGSAFEGESGYFSGSPSTLVWTAPLILGESGGGTLALRLSLEHEDLVLRWLDSSQAARLEKFRLSGTDLVNSRILLSKVEDFNVEYQAQYGGGWEANWDARRGSPKAVRINLLVDSRYWPELIVSI